MDKLIYTPYTYLLKFKPTGQVYYGVRFASNCHPNDFFIDYFTSSKIIKFLIENFGKEFLVLKKKPLNGKKKF